MRKTALLLLAATTIACISTSVAFGRSTAQRPALDCRASPVRYDASGSAGLSSVPWVKLGSGARAYLFYYRSALADGRVNESPGTVIYTGGGTSRLGSTKILWTPTHPGAGAVVTASKLDGPGAFTQRLARASGGVFPSIISIPSAGCWKLTLSTGKTRASMVVEAVDPPATLSCDATPLHPGTPSPISGTESWLTATPTSTGITGTIFYLPPDTPNAIIYPNKTAPDGANTKILWKVPNRTAGATLTVSALRLDAPAVMAPQTFPSARDGFPGASFPSGVAVSSTGCWLLTIRSGKAAGIAVFSSTPAA